MITLIAIVALSVLVLLIPQVRNMLTRGAYLIAPQMWTASSMITGRWNSVVANFHDKGSLLEENITLRDEINRMQAQILDRNLLAERVASLEGVLGRTMGDDRVVASVIVDYGKSAYDILVVDAGTENNVATGDMVVLAGSGVIGEIVEVTAGTSKVKLYSTPGVEISATVGEQAIPILAVGRGMGNFEAKVSEGSVVSVGDIVVSSKGNLVLGLVSAIEAKLSEPFKRLYFREPFNIFEIRSVEIVISKHS